MFDQLLGFLSLFDWLTPTAACVQDLVHGPSRQFHVPFGMGWSGHQIKELLQRHGVKTWGLMVIGDTIVFTVKQVQADWTEYLLNRHGVPISAGQVASTSGRHSTGLAGALTEWRAAWAGLLVRSSGETPAASQSHSSTKQQTALSRLHTSPTKRQKSLHAGDNAQRAFQQEPPHGILSPQSSLRIKQTGRQSHVIEDMVASGAPIEHLPGVRRTDAGIDAGARRVIR